MGRKRVVLTEEQKAARKAKYWGPDRNAKRRQKYAEDKEHREALIAREREKYRKTREEQGQSVRSEDCRENIGALKHLGALRVARFPDGSEVYTNTLTLEEFGKAIGRDVQVLYRWMGEEMFPRPTLLSRIGNRDQAVFTETETTALLGVFGEHQERSQYYRNYHEETRQRLFQVAQRELALVKQEARMNNDAGADHADPAAATPAAA